jgi:hypothetical protein
VGFASPGHPGFAFSRVEGRFPGGRKAVMMPTQNVLQIAVFLSNGRQLRAFTETPLLPAENEALSSKQHPWASASKAAARLPKCG